MTQTQRSESETTDDAEPTVFTYYLPAMATLSSEPGRVERVLKTVFRRRDPLSVLIRGQGR